MSKLLLFVLVGCSTPEPQSCDYTNEDRTDLTCLSIPAAKWNWRGKEIGDVFIGDICRARYDGEWIYGKTDVELIKETIAGGASFLDVDIEFITAYGEVAQYTCYYYNVE